MFQLKAKLIKNIEVIKNRYKIILFSPQLAEAVQPGQFVQVKVSASPEPLLRRPFSIHRTAGRNIEILYEIVGQGTRVLAQKKPGEYLDIIGPLGKGFNYSGPIARGHSAAILVAGGMGIAPLMFLAERLNSRGRPDLAVRSLVLIGAKTKGQIFCEKEFSQLGSRVQVSTDDGSRGFKGRVTGLLRKILAKSQKPKAKSQKPATCDLRPGIIYACGPRPMLREVSRISHEYNIPAQVSLEEHMACGIGACLGCVVNTTAGYQRVCKEGPVFEAEEIIWPRSGGG